MILETGKIINFMKSNFGSKSNHFESVDINNELYE